MPNIGYTSGGLQSNLQVQSSLAKAVTVDSELTTNSRTLHTLNVVGNAMTSERSDAYRNAGVGKGCDPVGVEYSWL